jgi:outer membrane protein
MKLLKCTIVIAALGFAVPAAAQTAPPSTQKPPAQQKPTPPPGVPAEAAKPTPPAPFPEGAKIAYIDAQYVVGSSEQGKAVLAQIQDLTNKKNAELSDKNKRLEDEKKKALETAGVMSEQARAQKGREIEKMERELEYAQQDAEKEVQAFQQKALADFGDKVKPIIEAIVKEKGLQAVLRAESGVIFWADPGLNISDEVVKRLNATKK